MRKILFTITCSLITFFAQAQCQAYFTYTQNGTTTIFNDLSFVNQGWSTNYSVSWNWDFGDGNYSTQQNPIHSYANNGMYLACLVVTFFDSTTINSCTSFFCDSILIGNSVPQSWDCNPVSGCFDPGTGLGQYSSFAACDTSCGISTPSWDCSLNTLLGCYDPGTGNGQFSSLAACQAACGISTSSWDCGPQGCYDPGTGLGAYTSLSACQAVCVSSSSSPCDSMILLAGQTMLVADVPNLNTIIYHWISTAPDGTVLGVDSMSNTHQIFNVNNGIAYDTIDVCMTYASSVGYSTCCVSWVWNPNLGIWAKMGSVTNTQEFISVDRKLVKVIDMLGKETSTNTNQILFFIYDNGEIEKIYINDK